jgi:hypothetical protein
MWDSFGDNVFNSIKSWEPEKKYPNENGYRDDLILFLREDLNRGGSLGLNPPEARIVPEAGRNLCDIGINNKIGIELKKDFKKISQSDRLVGQITRYLEQYDEIFIVTVGETNQNTLDHLKYQVKNVDNSQSFGFNQKQSITIIDKGSSNGPKKHRDTPDNGEDPFGVGGMYKPPIFKPPTFKPPKYFF